MPNTEIKKGHEVLMTRIPTCDVCEYEDAKPGVPAAYDARTKMGPWANVCEAHFKSHCYGTGLSRGQKFILQQVCPKCGNSGTTEDFMETHTCSVSPTVGQVLGIPEA